MKTTLLVLSLISASIALATMSLPVGPPLTSCYADTEVSTNVAFALDYARLDKLHLTLGCEAMATNSLEVLIGHDANADGCLSLEEADLTFGYDCGEWFVRDEGEGLRRREETPVLSSPSSEHFASGVSRRDLAVNWRDVSPAWNLIRVARRGPPAESAAVALAVENKKFVLLLR